MCFSATASIGAGVVLSAIGIATIKKVQHPSQLLFASIPLFFGVQQLAEGALWLTIPNSDYERTQEFLTYIFLFFAQVLWPIWVPLSILKLEKNSTKKNIQRGLVGIGLLIGMYLAYCLMTYNVEAKIVGSHITYIQNYPVSVRIYGVILYGLATIMPPFFSHIKHMWIFGIAIVISYIVSAIFYEHFVLSVWCFFASIISLSIYWIMVNISKFKVVK